MATGKKNTKEPIVINNIVIRPVVRTTQDIGKWRSALQSAESTNPQRILLYDLYSDLLLDAYLSSLIDKRILGVTKTALRYYDRDGKEVIEMTDLIGKRQFRNLRKEIMLQKFWGITVIELTAPGGIFKVYSVPRKHIRADLGRIVYEQSGTTGDNYKELPFSNYIAEIGDRYDLGLLLKAAPYVIYKRGGFGDWSKFAELFGMPFREARYDGFNDAVRIQLEKAMEQYGSAPWAVLPKEAEFTLHESKNTQGGGQLYDQLRKACNDELSVLILGQTETTTSSSSSGYAQSQTHAQVEDAINQSDREDELAIMNEQIAPILANLGYPIQEGGYFDHIIPGDELSKKDLAGVLVQLEEGLRLPIDDDYIYETFGIPKPADYNARKEAQANEASKPPEPPMPTKKKGKRNPRPTEDDTSKPDEKLAASLWNQFRHKLADFFDPAPES